jgi:asparagine synthase (glutamine-hydrolysing)
LGTNVISTLEGMFSFVFFDKKRNNLVMARDYLGKKPLYYFLDENKFFFASHTEIINKYIKTYFKFWKLL